MKLSKKMVSLICVSFISMISTSSPTRNIEDNSNLSSIKTIDEGVNSVIKSQNENNFEKNEDSKESDEADLALDEDIASEYLEAEVNELEEEKPEVIYIRDDITVESNISKEKLEEVLLNYNGASTMAHLADAFVDAEREYGVNAFAMAGIVALESGFATSRRAVEDNNLTGYEVYSDDSKGRLFDSQYESIMQTAKHLAKNYLSQGASYYNGVSIDAVQVNYCPDKKYNWHNKVDMLASGFFMVYSNINK